MSNVLVQVGVVVAIVFAVLLGLVFVYGPYFGVYLVTPSPQKVGKVAVAQMDQGLYSDTPEWQVKRQETLDALESVDSWDALVPVLDSAVKVAGGKHSFILRQQDFDEAQSEFTAPTHSLDDGIVTVSVPYFMGTPEQGQAYADAIGVGLYQPGVCGVIVDLRANTGGDMGPMLAGLSPLLPNGPTTTFVMKSGESPATITDGASFGGGNPTALSTYSGKLSVPVAILQGPQTASSGEQTLLAFRGLETARSFGEPSAGYASVNIVMPVWEDIQMALTVGTTRDRTGAVYGDSPIPAEQPTEDSEAASAARQWLADYGCRK